MRAIRFLPFLLAVGIPVFGQRTTDHGVLMDDTDALYKGKWVESTKQAPLAGKSYHHDDNSGQGEKTAVFSVKIARAGDYEVRLLYVSTNNRSTRVPVKIQAADEAHDVTINQREPCVVNGLPRALGVFGFAADADVMVTVSNRDADGFVIIDGLQIVPVAQAQAERAGERKSGFASHASISTVAKADDKPAAHPLAAAVAVSPLAVKTAPRQEPRSDTEPVRLARAASAGEVACRQFDLVVIGGTAGGVACAVRAAREGCTVLLVQHNAHIGGMLSNGLMQWDALYGGPRAPLFTELLGRIEQHYISIFGRNSRDHQIARYTHQHYPIGWVEPHVMERECNRLVAAERNLTLLLSHHPVAVNREGAVLKSVTLREHGTTNDIRVNARMFADATYEGDLFALAKVPCRIGREARAEFDEPHAGKIFCNVGGGPAPRDAVEGRLNIRAYGQSMGIIDETSPFTADGAIQAFNFRFCVSKDPANRVLPKRPANYNRDEYVNFNRKSIATNAGPNSKSHMNSPILPGENHSYPAASWPERQRTINRHRDFALGLMWFLQNDESVPEKQRAAFREWGLAKDEFPDNGHIPYEMYVREARRIVGRHVFREQDNMPAGEYARTPVMHDSIAITDWYMDSHACTPESRPEFHYDGKLILTEESRPAQIPYRALLPQGVDNLLVPVCLSATHVAWGAVRLEPVWMQTGEAAGFAIALSKETNTPPAALDAELLVRTLVKRRQMVTFFNDIKITADDPDIPAMQYFGTKGFFPGYDARSGELLDSLTADAWVSGLDDLASDSLKPAVLAARLARIDVHDARPVTAAQFASRLSRMKSIPVARVESVFGAKNVESFQDMKRGQACRLMYDLLGSP